MNYNNFIYYFLLSPEVYWPRPRKQMPRIWVRAVRPKTPRRPATVCTTWVCPRLPRRSRRTPTRSSPSSRPRWGWGLRPSVGIWDCWAATTTAGFDWTADEERPLVQRSPNGTWTHSGVSFRTWSCYSTTAYAPNGSRWFFLHGNIQYYDRYRLNS